MILYHSKPSQCKTSFLELWPAIPNTYIHGVHTVHKETGTAQMYQDRKEFFGETCGRFCCLALTTKHTNKQFVFKYCQILLLLFSKDCYCYCSKKCNSIENVGLEFWIVIVYRLILPLNVTFFHDLFFYITEITNQKPYWNFYSSLGLHVANYNLLLKAKVLMP